MLSFELDADRILSSSQHWQDLEQKWGEPVDLDTAECKNVRVDRLAPAFSTCALNRTTFDSAKYIDKLKRIKLAARRLQDSLASYDGFTEGISPNVSTVIEKSRKKPFYFVGSSLISKKSAEDICQEIDAMFADLEQTSFVTSTMRAAARLKNGGLRSRSSFPSIVEHSATVSGLSFDDTVEDANGCPSSEVGAGAETHDKSLESIVRYIDQLFDIFESTLNYE